MKPLSRLMTISPGWDKGVWYTMISYFVFLLHGIGAHTHEAAHGILTGGIGMHKRCWVSGFSPLRRGEGLYAGGYNRLDSAGHNTSPFITLI
jgi:hypothetical protein